MINITHKSSTLRKAIAQAIVKVSSQATIDTVVNKKVPKGDVFEMAKVAGLFAAKRTADMIPDCHPLPVEFTSVSYEVKELEILIMVEIHTIYKTGVEVEAMHAASVVALTMYDMLKPIDKNISIEKIKLVDKKGGKSDFSKDKEQILHAAVIVCSDSIAEGNKEDKAGKVIMKKLESLNVQVKKYLIIPDEVTSIQDQLKTFTNAKLDLVIFTGGTGLSPRDVTPEAIRPLIEREVPGIEEAIRSYGQSRMPYAMLSRSVAGLIGNTLVLALPGSTKGAEESMDSIFPAVLHIFKVLQGPSFRH
ncbi:bifunctional molybdenum cofactor biosynthesis protein MoaC/MoaB [Belliella kenyensis]|uniref:Molybdopterin adenylyltransferase n=1 Tax=Belliella kenyensis TaxID=1472724 RepID=A0ABV8EJ84_9BACT|nr:bifunctional molybdenum cofactor biosynthesis protein MoaC/MoaB [Belliella kenyensis]MCH7401058.1 bifunctional molybdenum cofactor biosynthesis protein MoaC/MoaB [Belliella kenyensis]MDN3604056.1 bifunctional molybdenum cofactor biosynthesis protein MoaC/MoaB [Belliella kenyensis]